MENNYLLKTTNSTIITMIVIIFSFDGLKSLYESFGKKSFFKATRENEDIESVTVIIPTYNGGEVLEKTLKSLLKKFPPKNIIVASNGSTDKNIDIARNFDVEFIDIKEPIGKVSAINYALKLVTTKYTLIIDDDVDIKDIIIPTGILENGNNAVAFKVYPHITNFLTKIQKYEYKKTMKISRGFFNRVSGVQNISGAIGLFSTKELISQIGIHTEEFSGEDLQRTLIILSKPNSKIVICDQVVETEVPQNLFDLFNQRIFG